MQRGKTPEKLLIPPPNLIDDCGSAGIAGLTARKRKSTFMTQMSKRISNQQLVIQSHTELINYIDNLQQKVQKIIESHDSQFLLAYKNHLYRVREEMQELKNKNANDANSASNQTQKVQTLQKELIIFREQALTLFDRMTEKDKTIQLLNMRIYELETQQKFNKRTVMQLMKKNKYLQGLVKDIHSNQRQGLSNHEENKKSLSFIQGNTMRKYSSNQKRASKHLGLTVHSFFNKNQGIYGRQQKQSRPTTTAVGSRRDTIQLKNSNKTKLANGYFTRNIVSRQSKD